MGGTSTSSQTQSATTAPWEAAQPAINGILGALNPLISNSGINATQTNAINSIEANAANGNQYAPAIQGLTSNLLGGGGATNQAGAVNNAYQQYAAQTQPLANNTNYNPYSTPGFSDAIGTMTSDITNGVNGQFAAAGRDMSGMNTQTLARGLTQGIAPTIANQYNQNVQNQQSAAGNLYNAGNTTAGLQTGMTQQGLANQQAGAQLAPTALDANNYTAEQNLAAEAQRQGIPAQTLGLLAQIGIPIAGLGSQSTGQSNGSQTMSGAQQFGTIMGGIGSLIPKAPMTFNF